MSPPGGLFCSQWPLCFFINSLFCFFVLFNSCCITAQVLGKTLEHISYAILIQIEPAVLRSSSLWLGSAVKLNKIIMYQDFTRRVDDFSFFNCFKSILFFVIEFGCTSSISYKIIYYVYYYYILVWLWWAVLTSFFLCPICFFPYSRLFSYLLRLILYLISFLLFPSASVWGKHSCMSFSFPVAILNGASFFARENSPCFGPPEGAQRHVHLVNVHVGGEHCTSTRPFLILNSFPNHPSPYNISF